MKIKHILAAALFTATLFTSCSEPAAPPVVDNRPAIMKGDQTLKIDLASSLLKWEGNMTGLKIYSHSGNINIVDGSIALKEGKITGGSFTIDMNTIKPTDANYTPDHPAEGLIGHLGMPEFFDVANNPTATFKINSVTDGNGKGILTLRGKSNEETIENIVITQKGEGLEITGTLKFNRKNYDVAFDMPAKDMFLSNDILMNVTLVAKK